MILKVITKTNNNYNDNTDCCDDVEIYSFFIKFNLHNLE